MIAGSRLARLFGPATEPRTTEPEGPGRTATVHPRLTRRGVPPPEEGPAEGVRSSDATAADEQPRTRRPSAPPDEPRSRTQERDIERVIERVTILREVSTEAVEKGLPPLVASGKRDDRSTESRAPTNQERGEPARTPEIQPLEPRPSVRPPLSSSRESASTSVPSRERHDDVEPLPTAPAVQPVSDTPRGRKSDVEPVPNTPTPSSRLVPPASVQPTPIRVQHVVSLMTPANAPRASEDPTPRPAGGSVASLPEMPARGGHLVPQRELDREAPEPIVSTGQVPPTPGGSPRSAISVTTGPAQDRGATPSRSRDVEARHDVSVRIGRVEIVAEGAKATPEHVHKRNSRLKQAARRHQIEPRLPIPQGRW